MKEKLSLTSKYGKVSCIYNAIKDGNDHSSQERIVIIAHGSISNKNSKTGTALAEKLNNERISTINLDLYGHGESEGDITYLTVSKALESILAVYDFVQRKGYSKIGLVGSSFSGILSLIAATKKRFDVLSLKCPVFDYERLWIERLGNDGLKEWKEKKFLSPFGKKLHYDIYPDSISYNMKDLVKHVKSPILVIHGTKDTTIPIEHSRDLINSVSSVKKKLIEIKGADHFFRDIDQFDKMIQTSFEWLKSNLE